MEMSPKVSPVHSQKCDVHPHFGKGVVARGISAMLEDVNLEDIVIGPSAVDRLALEKRLGRDTTLT